MFLARWRSVRSSCASQRLIDEQIGATVGAIALLANIIRELLTILFAPLLVKFSVPSP